MKAQKEKPKTKTKTGVAVFVDDHKRLDDLAWQHRLTHPEMLRLLLDRFVAETSSKSHPITH